ncbi:hypothetical protein [Aeoliella mucimassa]|uniref:YXWGXW repeat (2 copies) n=1 Tax=Aeoliella mucimassa TaxID=2527972 RepID=A0A518ASP9_9BACT|nr:hypothetical protein [Aeoliella mucimassa]QDU57759.1 hypothetical protein Pan181_39810 [Aeoliella mucimassa]
MKRLVTFAVLLALSTSVQAAPPQSFSPPAYTAPPIVAPYPQYPAQPMQVQPTPTFRWGWFGADYYRPATIKQRDYNGGYRQWGYRW